jgi:hypothetical protein
VHWPHAGPLPQAFHHQLKTLPNKSFSLSLYFQETLPTLQKLLLRNTLTNDSALQMLMSAFPNLQKLTLIETGVSDALIGYIIGTCAHSLLPRPFTASQPANHAHVN